MSLADAFIPTEQAYKNQVMNATWGHLAAKRSVKHRGYILFAAGEYGDLICIKSMFKNVPDSPWFYQHVHDFIFKKAGKREQRGKVFRFDGHYRVCLNGVGQFIGKVRVVRLGVRT